MPAHRVLISPAQGLPACCATAAEPDSRSTVNITNLRVRSLMSSPLACEMQKELVQSPTSACSGKGCTGPENFRLPICAHSYSLGSAMRRKAAPLSAAVDASSCLRCRCPLHIQLQIVGAKRHGSA